MIAVGHKHFETNQTGRDFVVGDLHGCFDQLFHLLKKVKFNVNIDRLFSVGDVIDRGEDSYACISLIYEPWFHMVKGNHEELMEGSFIHHSEEHLICWIRNGGLWYKNEDNQLLYDIALKIQELPLVISVGEGENRFNITHAEIIKSDGVSLVTNRDIDDWTFTKNEIDSILWGRNISDSYIDLLKGRHSKVIPNNVQSEDLSPTYVGHTTVCKVPVRIQQQIYIDTGCQYGVYLGNGEYPLTLACPQEQLFYCYNSIEKTLTKLPYNDTEWFK